MNVKYYLLPGTYLYINPHMDRDNYWNGLEKVSRRLGLFSDIIF